MGGAENLAVHVAAALADRGHESHLIVMEDPGVLSPQVPASVRLHHLGFHRASIRDPFRFPGSLRAGYRLLSGLIRSEGIEAVQTHLPGSNFWGLLLAWRRVCRVLATVHNNEEFRYGESDGAVRFALRKTAYRQIIRRTAGVVAVSAAVRDSLIRELSADAHDAARIHVVTNAVPVPAPLDPKRRQQIRDRFGVGEGSAFLLAAGRFTEQKNFGDLVTAAGHLAARDLPFRLVIAGDGEERAALLARIDVEGLGDRVAAPGNLTDLAAVMQAADLFVMSSRWEGLPLVLLEAMAAGLPVVAFAIDGVTELVTDGGTGRLATPGDPAALAEALADLSSDPDRRSELGGAGRALIEERFGFDRLIDQLEELYFPVGGGVR